MLEKFHGQKIGFTLLKSFFDAQLSLGYKKGYLWVLADNPTINFYEKTGGRFHGRTKDDEIAGQKVKELCYVWENIQL
jgi:GNAT superfamily N-acetyltransferase